jgi:hypothetical protein
VLLTELIVALAMFLVALVPLSLTIVQEHRVARLLYNRAVAGEILDGELEIFLAGEWRTLSPGTHPLVVRAEAAQSLPPGRFEATLDGRRLRLEWRADKPRLGGHTAREAQLPEP